MKVFRGFLRIFVERTLSDCRFEKGTMNSFPMKQRPLAKMPRIIKGNQEYTPEGWLEDYRDQTYKMEKMLADIQKGKEKVLKGIGKLSDDDLEAEIPMWRGTRQRKVGLYAYIGEVITHKGQIAALKGNIKRRREKDPDFLK